MGFRENSCSQLQINKADFLSGWGSTKLQKKLQNFYKTWFIHQVFKSTRLLFSFWLKVWMFSLKASLLFCTEHHEVSVGNHKLLLLKPRFKLFLSSRFNLQTVAVTFEHWATVAVAVLKLTHTHTKTTISAPRCESENLRAADLNCNQDIHTLTAGGPQETCEDVTLNI